MVDLWKYHLRALGLARITVLMSHRTFPVSAGAYRDSNPKSFLTHACTVDADGFPVTVLCKKVKLESILADTECATGDAPTCPVCAKRVA